MKLEHEQEIAADLERAEQSIQAAKVLAVKGNHDFAASRAYHTAFYGATAVCYMRVWISASIAASLLLFISDLSGRGN